MKLKPYSEYKDSGVEWIGYIPKTWESRRIKTLSLVRRGASPRPIDDPKYFDVNGEYSWVRISDVTASNKYLNTTSEKLSTLGKSLSVPIEPGELFISIAATVGKPIISNIKCCIHDGFIYFQNLDVDEEYLFYIFVGEQAYQGLGKLGTQLNLNTETIGNIIIPVPPKKEQQKISSFLDQKISEIDKTIQKDTELIELLKEKRIAIITHAVTKGIHPDAKMKDSGIEWIGEIPEDWEIHRLKFVSNLIPGQSPNEKTYNTENKGAILVNGPNEYSKSDFGYTRPIKWTTDPKKWAPKSSLLFCLRGSTTGRLNIAHENISIGRGVASIVAKKNQKFLNYIMIAMRPFVLANSKGSTFPSVTTDDLGNYLVPDTSLTEQLRIVNYLDNKISNIDKTIQKIESKIDLMEEYKKSLIHHVITGKIDVRGDDSLNQIHQKKDSKKTLLTT